MIQILGTCFCTFICAIIIKDKSRIFASIVSICGVILLTLMVLNKFSSIINSVNDLLLDFSSISGYFKIMIKVLGVTLITQIVTDICRDNGENALATITEIGAKFAIVTIVLPLLEIVIKTISGLLK